MKEKKQNEELQSRREFFKEAAKKALPVIGAIALASSPIIAQAAEMAPDDCTGVCSYGCGRQCSSGCSGSCAGTCDGACKGYCQGSCKGSCMGSCRGYSY